MIELLAKFDNKQAITKLFELHKDYLLQLMLSAWWHLAQISYVVCFLFN